MKYILIILALTLLASCDKPTKKYDCMRMYYSGLDIEFCGPNIKCTQSEDESGTVKICRDVRSDK